MYMDDETATFMMFNLSNQIVGYQQYRPDADKTRHNEPKDGRYFTYCKDKLGVWGLESFYYRTDVLCITEGVFKACRLHNWGIPAVAMISNDPKPARSWLSVLNRKIVSICDPDVSGSKLAKFGDVAIIPEWYLDDATDDQIKETIVDRLR